MWLTPCDSISRHGGVGTVLAHRAERGSAEDHAGRLVTGTTERLCGEHARRIPTRRGYRSRRTRFRIFPGPDFGSGSAEISITFGTL